MFNFSPSTANYRPSFEVPRCRKDDDENKHWGSATRDSARIEGVEFIHRSFLLEMEIMAGIKLCISQASLV